MKEIIIKKPQQQRSKAKFEAILQACPRVLAEFGYRKTTTAKIALEADVSIGSFYDYFSSKEAVFIAYLDHELNKALELVELDARRPELTALQSLGLFITTGVDFAEQQSEIIKLIFLKFPQQFDFIRLADSQNKIAEIAFYFFEKYGDNFSKKSKNPELMIYTLTNIVLGFQLRIALFSDKKTDKNLKRNDIIGELTGIIANYIFD